MSTSVVITWVLIFLYAHQSISLLQTHIPIPNKEAKRAVLGEICKKYTKIPRKILLI